VNAGPSFEPRIAVKKMLDQVRLIKPHLVDQRGGRIEQKYVKKVKI
jgi:hypothetical protein